MSDIQGTESAFVPESTASTVPSLAGQIHQVKTTTITRAKTTKKLLRWFFIFILLPVSDLGRYDCGEVVRGFLEEGPLSPHFECLEFSVRLIILERREQFRRQTFIEDVQVALIV